MRIFKNRSGYNITFQEKDNKTKIKKFKKIPSKLLKLPKGYKKAVITIRYGNSKKTIERIIEKYGLDSYEYKHHTIATSPNWRGNGKALKDFIFNEAEIREESLEEKYLEEITLNELQENNIEPFPIRNIIIKWIK